MGDTDIAKFEEVRQILAAVSAQIMILQEDDATVKDVIIALEKISGSWHDNSTLQAILNKTGTSKVGAISKAQKAQNIFLKKT